MSIDKQFDSLGEQLDSVIDQMNTVFGYERVTRNREPVDHRPKTVPIYGKMAEKDLEKMADDLSNLIEEKFV